MTPEISSRGRQMPASPIRKLMPLAEDAKRRYTIDLRGEDKNYYYLYIKPNFAADKADFAEARVALFNTTFLPREVSFRQPNGTMVKWDVDRINTSAPLSAGDLPDPEVTAILHGGPRLRHPVQEHRRDRRVVGERGAVVGRRAGALPMVDDESVVDGVDRLRVEQIAR